MPENAIASRGTADLVDQVRSEIVSGTYSRGRLLPGIRALSSQYGVSPETARRGLKVLEAEGLLVSQPRQGFRVVSQDVVVPSHCPVAYVTGYLPDMSDAQSVNWVLSQALQGEAGRRGWTTLGVHVGQQGSGAVHDQLKAARSWGAVVDTLDAGLLEASEKAGLPVVMVNSWFEDAAVDVVLQDNYRGGFLAADHLVEAGVQRIGWVGAAGQFCHSRERYAGAVGALAARGRSIAQKDRSDMVGEALNEGVRKLLSRKDRPDGLLAFDKVGVLAVKTIAADLGLRIGKDLQVVGWCVEELYESEYRTTFAGGPTPPAVVWKASSMSEWALNLLVQRREGKGGESVRISVPTRLRKA